MSHSDSLPASALDPGPLPERGTSFAGRLTLWAERGGDLLRLWLTKHRSPNTRRAYRADLVDFFGCEEVSLDRARSVDSLQVDAYLERMERSGSPPSTLSRRLSAIRGFFGWLVAQELLGRSPVADGLVRRIPSDTRSLAVVVLTAEEAQHLIAAAGQPPGDPRASRDRALVQAGLYLALRRAELAAMRAEHFQERDGHRILLLPHSKGGRRDWVKVPRPLVVALDHYTERCGITDGPFWRSHSRRNRGEALGVGTIYRIIRKAAARAGLSEKVTPHTLRHTACTLAIEGGASLQQVQTHARHRNIQTTMRYVHQREVLANNASDHIYF